MKKADEEEVLSREIEALRTILKLKEEELVRRTGRPSAVNLKEIRMDCTLHEKLVIKTMTPIVDDLEHSTSSKVK